MYAIFGKEVMLDTIIISMYALFGLAFMVGWFLFWKMCFRKLGHTSPTFWAVLVCIPIINTIVLFAVGLELLYLLFTGLNKRLKEKRKMSV